MKVIPITHEETMEKNKLTFPDSWNQVLKTAFSENELETGSYEESLQLSSENRRRSERRDDNSTTMKSVRDFQLTPLLSAENKNSNWGEGKKRLISLAN